MGQPLTSVEGLRANATLMMIMLLKTDCLPEKRLREREKRRGRQSEKAVQFQKRTDGKQHQ
jgi:hypothetical protein